MTQKNRKTQEQKDEEARILEARRKKIEEDKYLFTRVFNSADGKRVLNVLMKRCKYQSPISSTVADGSLSTENMIHNAALQGLYLWLRKQINNPEVLIAAEIVGFDNPQE